MTPSFDLVPQSAALDDVVAEAQRLVRAARASSSIAAYESDFRLFADWASQHGLQALPATGSTVALYAAALSALHFAPATIKRRLASIATIHLLNGYTHRPASCRHTPLGEIMRGIRRTQGVTPQQAKDPLLTEDLRRILAACPDSLLGLRDRALLGISFSGAFRRSETISLLTTDLDFLEAGVLIRINRSKTDPFAAGRLVGIPRAEDEAICPVRGD
ncbi:MAG TPA: hypothetical protein VMR02_13160 [Terracidiphilus sp.]|jgi:site-specific recombinase XerD|nr:hypothetical protein [Terracidiphilus sp.]